MSAQESSLSPSTLKRTFNEINDRQVDEISIEYLYKPRTITLLLVCISALVCLAFTRDDSDPRANTWTGIGGVFIFFMVISVLTFPNGPFTRPHPILWRMVFGCSIIHLMIIQFLIHQDYKTVRSIVVWLDVRMENYTIDSEKEYGAQCWNITWDRIWSHLDWFAFAHFWGWGMKALLIRHYGICWSISIMWELTEVAFGHLLPNFYECWWDNLVLDVLICNGLGIFTGMTVCRWLEMREHHWESIKNIGSKSGKLKRALLQFTPEYFSPTRWLDPACGWMRFVAIFQLVLIFQIIELNTFFIKHIFPMPPEHPICIFRMLLTGLVGAPAIRQYYSYVTDRRCTRLGSQAWVVVCIAFSELTLNIKFGLDLFSRTQLFPMVMWLLLNVLISISGTFASMKVFKWRYPASDITLTKVSPEDDSLGRILDSCDQSNLATKASGDASANNLHRRMKTKF